MIFALQCILVALPFASAALLACVASWRAGVRINAASSSLLFVLACLLPWQHGPGLPVLLALLTGFVAMTTSWLGWRDIRAALAARRLDRRRSRHQRVVFQVLLGAILLAVLSDRPAVTWLGTAIAVAAAAGLTGTVRTPEAQRAADRLLLLCGVGLMLALFGTLLLYMTPEPDIAPRWGEAPLNVALPNLAVVCLVLGYGGIAGLVPLHAWLPDAVAGGTAQGAALVGAVLVNVPLFTMLRLCSVMAESANAAVALLLALGLVTLLLASFWLSQQVVRQRSLAFAGTAQIGIIAFAFGLGRPAATFGGLVILTLLTLSRAAELQCPEAVQTRMAAWTRAASCGVLAGLPILALFLIAGAVADQAPLLLLPLGVGAVLTAGSLITGATTMRASSSARGSVADMLELAPIWLELAVVVLLAVAMPGIVADWFRAMVASGR